MNDAYGSQIKEWDWHYRVGFDQELAERVNHALIKAKGSESSVKERTELDFYQQLISVDCLVNQCIEQPSRAEEFLQGCARKSVLHLPRECAEKVSDRLRQCQLSHLQLKGLQDLIVQAQRAEFFNYSKHLLELALGDGFLSIAKGYLAEWCDAELPNRSIEPGESPQSLFLVMDKYAKAALLYGKEVLGSAEMDDPVWNTRFSDEISCFAEYWPSLITGVEDELVIGQALGNAGRADVIGSLIHEIAGHACFYQLASTGYFAFLDHGATCIIEGWATWCEWNSPLSTPGYTSRLKLMAARNLGLAEFASPSDVNAEISRLMAAFGSGSSIVEQGLINFYQYPSYAISYFAGATWFELKFQDVAPDSFWRSRKGAVITNVLDSVR